MRIKLISLVVLVALSMQSCMQLRMTEKKQQKELDKYGIKAEFGFVETEGRKLHYTFTGRDSLKPLIMFVHGSPGSSSNFIQYAQDSVLLNKFQILLVDRPGYGDSDFGKSEPSINAQAKMLNQMLSRFKATQKILVGHSLGGPIIAKMAMDNDAQIQGLVIVSGSVAPDLEPEEWWRSVINSRIVRWMVPRSFRVSNEEIIPVKAELEAMDSLWGRITSDVTIIHGDKDMLVPYENAIYAKERLINASNVELIILKETNHFIPFTKAEIIKGVLMNFSAI